MSYYPEWDSHIRDKVKVLLGLADYLTKTELEQAIGIDTSDLARKKIFIVSKGEVDKQDINKLTNVPTEFDNLEAKVNDLDIFKLKTVPVHLKKLSDVLDKEVVKNTKFNSLKTKVINLEKKIPDTTILIPITQCNTDKQNLEKKILTEKTKTTDLATTTVLNTKISGFGNKMPEWFSDYNCFEYEIRKVQKNISDYSKYITTH